MPNRSVTVAFRSVAIGVTLLFPLFTAMAEIGCVDCCAQPHGYPPGLASLIAWSDPQGCGHAAPPAALAEAGEPLADMPLVGRIALASLEVAQGLHASDAGLAAAVGPPLFLLDTVFRI